MTETQKSQVIFPSHIAREQWEWDKRLGSHAAVLTTKASNHSDVLLHAAVVIILIMNYFKYLEKIQRIT